jgi:hypothetical protein
LTVVINGNNSLFSSAKSVVLLLVMTQYIFVV